MKIAIFGAGAVGSYIGAFLARKDEDVTLIDPWPENIEAIKAHGIKVRGSQGPFTVPVKGLHLHEVQRLQDHFDIAFIAVKSYDTHWATSFMQGYLKPEGYVISSQNGVNDEILASIVGKHRTLGCVMSSIEVALWEPGVVTRGGAPGRDRGHNVFRVGELSGLLSPRTDQIVRLVSCIDGAQTTSNLKGERWSKLTTNCMGNPVGAMSGLGSHGQADNPEARRLKMLIAREVVQVGIAMGYRIESISGLNPEIWLNLDQADAFLQIDTRLQVKGRTDWHASMAQDVMKGRRTEIDYLNGLVARNGRAVGIPTPFNDKAIVLIHDIESQKRSPSPNIIAEVLNTPSCNP